MKYHAKYEQFLNDSKKLVGLTDYKIILSPETLETDSMAEVDPDIYEKELTVMLSADFHKLSHDKKKNVLLHELLHGRIEIFNIKKAQVVEELEEDLVNDMVRGFERHKTLNW